MKFRGFFLCWLALSFAGLSASTGVSGTSEGTLIVLNKSEASASLISLQTGETVTKIPTGPGPHEAAVSADGRVAVVANYGVRGEPGNTLTVIDLPTQRIEQTIDLGEYQRPHGLVLLADDRTLLVTAEAQKALLLVDIEKGKVAEVIETGQEVSHMVAYSAEHQRAFVANIGSGSVTVVDLEQGKAVKNITTGAGAEGIDVSPDGEEVWVSNRAADSISIIAADSLNVVATLKSKSFPIRVKFTPNGKFVLVSNARSGDVAVFEAETRKEVQRINMDVEAVAGKESRLFSDRFGKSPVPVGILIHPDGKTAFVANTNADIVTVLDLQGWRIVERLQTGQEPDGLGLTALEFSEAAVK